MVDIFNWATNSTIENGEHVLNYVVKKLTENGLPVTPIIGYDRWEDPEYSNALSNLSGICSNYAIRLESYAFDDMLDEDHFLENIDDIIATLDLNTSNCNVILDFGDVTKKSVIDLQESISTAINLISKYNFKFVSVAGCSITAIINEMVPKTNTTNIVLRREMIAWQACKKTSNLNNLVFGDYGISSPSAPEGIIAPHANGKIRYTVKNNYFVVRGHSLQQGEKGAQMYELAQKVIDSDYYMGADFSWGDQRITDCSKGMFKGNLLSWIAIDTNHHSQAVLSEIFEFETSIVTRPHFSVV